ncbi:F1F0 ATPase subunit 2 [Pseudomonas graminis]|uniref:ATP synthase subunit I n=1 Tax=Pseudomonas graminis TaxID=158627 RepID=UPI00105F013E|nr:ATP synthase subunit I [Pseudomonas graminis]TDV50284.1 F1F0 ATPase subunit 2 [Pseudomonas graminis]
MNDGQGLFLIITTVLAGAALGVFFFGGLWWTVRRGAVSSKPAHWFVGSLIVRTALVLTGFYLAGAGQPLRLGACMLGFLLARVVVLRVTRLKGCEQVPATCGPPPCA